MTRVLRLAATTGAGVLFLVILGAIVLTVHPVWGNPALQESATPDVIQAEALNPNANVRALPSTDATIVTVIQPGEVYRVLGRYFEWLMIEQPQVPGGYVWVHQSVVRVTGDVNRIPQVNADYVPNLIPYNLTPSVPPSLDATRPTLTSTATTPDPVGSPSLSPRATFTSPAVLPTAIDVAAATRLAEPDAEILRRQEALRQIFEQQPVILFYGDSPIVLYPAEIGFALDNEKMIPEISASLALDGVEWLAAIEIHAGYSTVRLRTLLQDIALRYDPPPLDAFFDGGALTFQPPPPSLRLDIQAALVMVEAALRAWDGAERQVELPLAILATPLSTEILEKAIENYFRSRGIAYNGGNSVISVYVKNLATNEIATLQARVLHSATSTIKIGIMANYFRTSAGLPPDEVRFYLAASAICSANGAANILTEITDQGRVRGGLQRTSETFCLAGATNTFITRKLGVGPAGEGGVPADYYTATERIPCPTDGARAPDLSLNTRPDPDLQTTAEDMGIMLEAIYHCANGSGGLLDTFPGEIDQTECRWMLEILSGTRFLRLAELGVPEGVEFAHKVGYGGESVGDAGIVFSPGGDYIFVMYIWDDQLDDFGAYALQRWNLIAEISRLVYNFFNPDAPLTQPRIPPNPNGGVGCVLPPNGSEINFEDINAGRFDAGGLPLGSACYDYPSCRPFEGWDR